MTATLIQANAMRLPLADGTVQCVITSPPYWALRAYEGEQQAIWGGDSEHEHEWDLATCTCGAWSGALGLEPTPEMYVEHMVTVFREVRRVLRDDGTCWLNMGDSYASGEIGRHDRSDEYEGEYQRPGRQGARRHHKLNTGLKPKDLVMMPFEVARALRLDGWWLRADIVWSKPNPMPESITDRPTKSHEYLFLLAKSKRYFYDADAIREPHTASTIARITQPRFAAQTGGPKDYAVTGVNPNRSARRALENLAARVKTEQTSHAGGRRQAPEPGEPNAFHANGRNKRSVWTIPTSPYPGAHFATFPPALVELCILAGTSPKACGECGAPWARVSERKRAPDRASREQDRDGDVERHGPDGRDGSRYSTTNETIGWQPTCAHDDDTGRCLVLDPFGGSGTVGQVALEHGRDAVLIDVSREYLDMATRRLYRLQRMPVPDVVPPGALL